MSYYPEKYRKRTIEYRQEGHTLEETHSTFKVSISTIRQWERQLKEQGHLQKKVAKHKFKKIDPKRLQAYIQEHPDAYLNETAEAFHCTAVAIHKAFRRLGITRKKRQSVSKSKILQK